jgi:hypothetical protein
MKTVRKCPRSAGNRWHTFRTMPAHRGRINIASKEGRGHRQGGTSPEVGLATPRPISDAGQRKKKDPADPGSEHCGVSFTWLLVYIGIL